MDFREYQRKQIIKSIQDSINIEEILISEGKLERPYENVSLKYHERYENTFKQKYDRIDHFGEVFNRIMCLEQNKPSLSEISKIKGLL